MDTAATLQRLLDLEEIKTLKHRYIRYMTHSLWAELERVLTPDVEASYSDGKYSFSGRDALLAFLRGAHDAASTQVLGFWHVTMPEIEFRAADEARGIWAMYHFYLDKQDMQQLEMFAYYDDIYRRMDGRWLIARTSYERVMEQTLDRRVAPGLQLNVG